MNVTKSDLANLLQIEESRVKINRMKQDLEALSAGEQLRLKEDERIAVAGQLSLANQSMDELQTELKRAEGDLGLVEARIERDTKALAETSSSKDATGLQHELQTLAKRKSDLEDVQLELIDRLDEQRVQVETLSRSREMLAIELAELKESLTAQVEDLRKQIGAIEESSESLAKTVDSEVLGLYRKKSERGIAIGRLVKLTCSACNMGLTSATQREMSATASDQLVTCPECSAILVREI